MGKPKVYLFAMSPPCRAVQLTARALNLDIEEVITSTLAKDHLKPEFLKLNPQHTIPTLDDNGKVLWDSHAIMKYLVEVYGKNSTLVPSDPYNKARLDQRLHFDDVVLFARLREVILPVFTGVANKLEEEKVKKFEEALDFLEIFLKDDLYLVGNTLTIADFSNIVVVSSFLSISPVDKNRYPKLLAWVDRVAQLPYYEELNGKVVAETKAFVLSKLSA